MRISAGIEKICAERLRQMSHHGFTMDHDLSKNDPGRLVGMALERCVDVENSINGVGELDEDQQIHQLTEAGALIAAEIDVLINKKHGVEANSTIGGIWRA